MGQQLAWYRRVSAQALQRHKCLHGRMSVSLTSDKHTTHSALLSLISSSATLRYKIQILMPRRSKRNRWKNVVWCLPLILGCCIYSLSHRSPAVDNSLHPPGEKKHSEEERQQVSWARRNVEEGIKAFGASLSFKGTQMLHRRRKKEREEKMEYSPLASASEASHSSSRPCAVKQSNSWILIYFAGAAVFLCFLGPGCPSFFLFFACLYLTNTRLQCCVEGLESF